MYHPLLRVVMLAGSLAEAMPALAGEPVFLSGGPDAAAYGEAAGFPAAPSGGLVNSQPFMVGSYSHYDAVFPAHAIAPASVPAPWQRAPAELELTYTDQGTQRSIADYLARNPTTGLLVARGGKILFEHYQYGRTGRDRFVSQSMAKTITAMLIGIAVGEGAIRSIDDPAQAYVPGLAGTELGRTSLRALLHMASGIGFVETYDGHDDAARLGRALFTRPGLDPIAAVAQFNTRVAPPGAVFSYGGVNTETLGLVLAHATGTTLSHYLESRIWQPMGAEAGATWTVDGTGQEIAYCCISAVLRDYARFALLLADGGAAGARQIIPRQWVLDATSLAGAMSVPNSGAVPWAYGYQTWLMPGPRGDFALEGIHGQRIFIDPGSRLVLVHTAVRVPPRRGPGDDELLRLWRALLQQQTGLDPARVRGP